MGAKKLSDVPISAFSISPDGKFLAMYFFSSSPCLVPSSIELCIMYGLFLVLGLIAAFDDERKFRYFRKLGFVKCDWLRKRLPHDPLLSDAMFYYSGSSEGDLSIVDATRLVTTQRLRSAHMVFVTSMEFSPNGRLVPFWSGNCSISVSTPLQ